MEKETFNKAREIMNDIEALELAIKTIKGEGNPNSINPCLERDRVLAVDIEDCTHGQTATFRIDNLDNDIQLSLFKTLLELYESKLKALNYKLAKL